MERSDVLESVRRHVAALHGVLAFEYLEGEFKENVLALEHEVEKNGACGGLMPFTNQGVWKAFERQVQFVIVAESSAVLLGASEGLVFISDQKGQIVGEWLNAKRQEELKGRADVCFLSTDFVLYPDVEVNGEPFFVLPEVDFPYLKDIPGVKNVTSGSISTLSDDFIRARLGYGETKHWTHLVGFDVDL
jgi:hypothetical protein